MLASRTSARNPPALPSVERLREFHRAIPLQGASPNDVLSLPDDLVVYLVAAVRNAPREPPAVPPEEWDRLVGLLFGHGILPLMRSHLRTWPESCRPPKRIMAQLDQIFLAGVARNLIISRQVQSVTAALESAGVPIIVLKGPVFARTIYDDPSVRQCIDIDLLVQPRYVDACDAVLRSLGYSCDVRHFTRSQSEIHHDNYHLPGLSVKLELHWTLSYTIPIFPESWLEEVFARKLPLKSGDLSCYMMDPRDHFLYLIFHHILQHYYLRLDRICDIALLLESLRTPEDWQAIREQCTALHLIIPLQYGLTAAQLWCGIEIPQGSPGYPPLPPPSKRDIRIWENVTQRREHLHSSLYLSLQGLPGTKKKLRFIGRFILPPRERIVKYRKSDSAFDIPLAHIRRWISLWKYL